LNGVRAFFAIALEGDALVAAEAELARLRAAPGAGALRFVRPEGLHVTLRFLGEIPRERVTPLAASVGVALAGVAPFEATLGGVEAFPSARRPRVLALGLGPPERITTLAAGVERGVVAAGFAPEPRPFRGHVTLGRAREGRRLEPALAAAPAASDAAPASFRVRHVVLFESALGAGGSRYLPLERVPLGGDDHPRSTPAKE